MIEFGKSLRQAREAKGYTISQIADMTHLKASIVENLENEDFSHIAAPIYGRGFVKLYCEAVGLEVKPHVDEFMAIMNGEHEIAIKERPVEPTSPTPPPQPAPVPQPIPAPLPEPDLFKQESAPLPEPVAPEPPVSRYAPPTRPEPFSPRIAPQHLRIALLASLAIILLAALLLGIWALYRATTSDAKAPDAQEAPVAEKADEPDPKPVPAEPVQAPVARTQQKIPSLYID